MGHYTYLLLDLFAFIGPLALSFDRKVAFYKSWRALFPSILITAALFTSWDIAFTIHHIWSFSPDYTLGITWLHLPLEEWLFFIVVPYAVCFVHSCVVAYWGQRLSRLRLYFPFLAWAIVMALAGIATLSMGKYYSAIAFLFFALTLLLFLRMFPRSALGSLLITLLLSLIPFMIMNGILTALPVVSYDNHSNLGFRVTTIPIEDFFYGFSMLLCTLVCARILFPFSPLTHHNSSPSL